jgi:hypothetical protein
MTAIEPFSYSDIDTDLNNDTLSVICAVMDTILENDEIDVSHKLVVILINMIRKL